MGLSIDDLLNSLQDPSGGLSGSMEDIWRRIREKDSFDELGLDKDELAKFLKEWIEENPYSAM